MKPRRRTLRWRVSRCLLGGGLVLLLGLGSGCLASKTLVVSDGQAFRLGPDVRGRVYAWNGTEWVLSDKAVRLPEWWFCLQIGDSELMGTVPAER